MKKQVLSILLSAVMLIGSIQMTACGEKMPEPEKSKVDHVYKATNIELGDNIDPNEMIVSGDELLIYASEITNRKKYEYQNVFLNVNIDTGDVTKTVIPKDDNDYSYLQSIASDSEDNIYFLKQTYDNDTDLEAYRVERYTDGGTELICNDVTPLFEESDDDTMGSRYFYVSGFIVDGDGNFYFSSDGRIVVCDKEFKKLFQIDIFGRINDFGMTSDGRVYASYRDYNVGGSQISYIDIEKKGFGDPLALPENESLRNAEFFVGAGYDLYYKDTNSLYGFNSADGESVELLNFVNSDVNPNNISMMSVVDQDTVICYTREYSVEEVINEMLLMKRIPEDEIPEKYIIKVGYYPSGDGFIESTVVKFNRASDEYRIELIDYGKYSSSEDYSGQDQLEKEILEGTAPDIISMEYFGNADNWIAQGVFTDINKLIEKDESFDRSEYFERILDEYTDENGRMYRFVTSFELNTILANAAYIDFEGWDANKFIDFISDIPEGSYIAPYMSRQQLIYMALACSMDSFIDYKNATCSFDSDSFKKLLETAKNIPENFSYYSSLTDEERADYNNDSGRPYREGKIILDTNNGYIYSLVDYSEKTVQYGKDIEVNIVGYPTNSGNGAIINPRASYGINEKSLLKEGAWEFVKTLASASNSYSWGFHTNLASFENSCANSLGTWYYFCSNSSMGFGDPDMTYEEAMEQVEESLMYNENGVLVRIEQEHVDALKELINGAQALPNLENKVFEMINEEAEFYYSGAKSLDETAKIIQDRVSTYISENS